MSGLIVNGNSIRKSLSLISLVATLSLILTSCSGTGRPLATTPPTTASTEVNLPTSTEPPAPTQPPATLVPIDLAGPVMALGSKYLYVDGTVLLAVPGGPFTMGYYFENNPERILSVGDMWVYSTKVTNQQYAVCVNAGDCSQPDLQNNSIYGDDHSINRPVTGVTYAQAADYCTFVHGRLPTEAEWEKTARGPDANLYPWGDAIPSCPLLNFKNCVGANTTNVNDYKDGVSYYGAFDMAGNAREWVADWFSPTYNLDSPAADPLGPEIGEKRSVRGSSYQDRFDDSLSAHRFSLLPTENLPDLSFRCVVEDPAYFAPWCEQLPFVGVGLDGSPANCAPIVQCNDVSISQSPSCRLPDYVPYTIVTFKLSNPQPADWSYDLSGCQQIPGEKSAAKDKFLCNVGASGPAQVQGSCNITAPAGCQICPDHYSPDGAQCVWDGSSTSGTACLPGSTYDAINQCCTSGAGSAANINLCPAGTYPLNGLCVANPDAVKDSAVQAILFDDKCTPPITGGGDPGGGNNDDGGDGIAVTPPGCVLFCRVDANGNRICVCR